MFKNDPDSSSGCVDINDVFDSISFIEENLSSSGFKDGFEKGKIDGEIEGYHLGYHRGAEIGSELGYYKGFLEVLKKSLDPDSLTPVNGVIEKLNALIESFPQVNDESIDLIALRNNIQSTYKRLCSLLKLDSKIPESSQLNF